MWKQLALDNHWVAWFHRGDAHAQTKFIWFSLSDCWLVHWIYVLFIDFDSFRGLYQLQNEFMHPCENQSFGVKNQDTTVLWWGIELEIRKCLNCPKFPSLISLVQKLSWTCHASWDVSFNFKNERNRAPSADYLYGESLMVKRGSKKNSKKVGCNYLGVIIPRRWWELQVPTHEEDAGIHGEQ